jgi:AcrR family transcriptional regulator
MTTANSETAETEPVAVDAGQSTWRDRALERSLATAKAKAMSRSDRFIATAMEILQETGRTDFTVQELVDRSKTSLRSFYQYFSGKDELLLALLEESIVRSVASWRAEIEGKDAIEALKIVVISIYVGDTIGAGSLNRGLAPYHVGLADSHSKDYERAIAPMARIIHELIERAVDEGTVRSDVPPRRLAVAFIQALVGSTLFTALSKSDHDRLADGETMWTFLHQGLASS